MKNQSNNLFEILEHRLYDFKRPKKNTRKKFMDSVIDYNLSVNGETTSATLQYVVCQDDYVEYISGSYNTHFKIFLNENHAIIVPKDADTDVVWWYRIAQVLGYEFDFNKYGTLGCILNQYNYVNYNLSDDDDKKVIDEITDKYKDENSIYLDIKINDIKLFKFLENFTFIYLNQ